MSAQNQPGSSLELQWGISQEEFERRERMRAKPIQPNEFRCPECNLRVTITDSQIEVGHENGRKGPMCPNHPDYTESTEQQAQLTDW